MAPPPSVTPSEPDFEARVRASFARQELMQTLGAELAMMRTDFCEIRLPYRDALSQQHGYFHAGATAAVADSAGGYAAFTLMGHGDSVLAVEFKINLLEPAHGDALFARGQVLRSGRTLSVCRVDVFVARDGEEKQCAAMQQTVIRLAASPEAPDTG